MLQHLAERGVDPSLARRALSHASPEQVELVRLLVGTGAGPRTPGPDRGVMSTEEYQAVLSGLGEDYVGPLTRRGLTEADVGYDQLLEAVEVLAETAGMLRAVPTSRQAAMWSCMTPQLQIALGPYQTVARALTASGVAGALDAQNHVVLTNLRREVIPDLDLDVLRLAGATDPELVLVRMIREAHAAPQSLLSTMTVAQLLDEGTRLLQKTNQPPPAPPERKPKRWAGWGKLLSGIAVAGANIAGGVALGLGGGPFAAGASLGGVIASCGAGVGSICEGVSAFRGE